MRRTVLFASLALLVVASAQPVCGAFSGLVTFGIGWASIAVGALGAANGLTGANGGGAGNRIITGVGGTAVGVFDPSDGTFYEGQLVIDYPADLVSVAYVGWFGNFAVDPALAVPPETAEEQTGFYDSNGVTYQLQQAPNPSLNAAITNSGGVLTINFNDPAGVSGNSAGDFNFLDVAFANISGQPLAWAPAVPGGLANFFENNALSTVTCIPDPSFTAPVGCGLPTAPIAFFVSVVTPEPRTFGVAGIGLFGLFAFCRWRRNVSHR